jgi:hypothetical protein
VQCSVFRLALARLRGFGQNSGLRLREIKALA